VKWNIGVVTSNLPYLLRGIRVTVAVTLWALLELYKRGEATWEQDEPFGDITVAPRARAAEVDAA